MDFVHNLDIFYILDCNLDTDYNLDDFIFLATDDADINGWTYFDF